MNLWLMSATKSSPGGQSMFCSCLRKYSYDYKFKPI